MYKFINISTCASIQKNSPSICRREKLLYLATARCKVWYWTGVRTGQKIRRRVKEQNNWVEAASGAVSRISRPINWQFGNLFSQHQILQISQACWYQTKQSRYLLPSTNATTTCRLLTVCTAYSGIRVPAAGYLPPPGHVVQQEWHRLFLLSLYCSWNSKKMEQCETSKHGRKISS
jgi:hypothetical protein